MSSNRRFNLIHNNHSIRTIDDLREYCAIEQLLIDYREGKLRRWLKALKIFNNVILAIDNIAAEDELDIMVELVKILDIDIEIAEEYKRKYLEIKCLFDTGNDLLNSGQYKEAISFCNQSLEIDSCYINAYWVRGIAYSNLKEYEKAISDLNKIIELNPDDGEAYCARGTIHRGLNQYEKAISDYTKAIELNPDSTNAYRCRSADYIDLEEYEKALNDCNKVLELDPYCAYTYYCRGNAFCGLIEYEKAISDFETALRLNPTFSNARNNYEIAYLRLDRIQKC
jgi:tetratricopeptide (TPR) repeat protein